MSYVETSRIRMPAVGLGTWRLDNVEANVVHALEVGYRHVDTAQSYGNEAEVGRGIAAGPVDRDEVFLTTKVRRELAAPRDVVASTETSLRTLGTDYVDLLLLHWPSDAAPLEATLEAMTALLDRELTRFIGVSNFPSELLARAIGLAPVATNQVEHHPYLAVDAIRRVAEPAGIAITAYAPVARGAVAHDPVLTDIAAAHGATPGAVAMAFLLSLPQTAVIPKSSDPDRIETNFVAGQLELTADERSRIAGLARGERLVSAPFDLAWDPDEPVADEDSQA